MIIRSRVQWEAGGTRRLQVADRGYRLQTEVGEAMKKQDRTGDHQGMINPQLQLQANLNKQVFKDFLKEYRVSELRICSGRRFHIFGAATLKARSVGVQCRKIQRVLGYVTGPAQSGIRQRYSTTRSAFEVLFVSRLSSKFGEKDEFLRIPKKVQH